MSSATMRRGGSARGALMVSAGLVLSSLLHAPTRAAVQVFADRGLWEATLGGTVTTEDFESFTSDVDFSFSTTTLTSGFSLTHTGQGGFRNLIDVPAMEFAGQSNGTASASLFTDGDGPDAVTMSLDVPGLALGFDMSDVDGGGGEGSRVEVIGVDDEVLEMITIPTGMSRFVGFTVDGGERIAALRFSSASADASNLGEGFFIDNVAIEFVGQLPEPTAAWLLACGGVGLAVRRRVR